MTSSRRRTKGSVADNDHSSTWARLRTLVTDHLGVSVEEPIEAWNCVRQEAHKHTSLVSDLPILQLDAATCKSTLARLRVVGLRGFAREDFPRFALAGMVKHMYK
jgi:hypothetical protein